MHKVHDDLGAMDLNLLRALDALIAERHVTRAAARLGITQSAASHALARLRELLGDPLLVRGRAGNMLATPRGLALGAVVQRALADVAAAWRPPAAFDPATARRTFHVGASDYAELVLLPALVARLAERAPGVDLFVHAVPRDLAGALAAGDLDAVLAPARPEELTADCYQRLLFDEHFVCAVRRGHPAAGKRLTLDRFCALRHVLIAPRGTPGGFVDDALAARGRTRHVALHVPHFLIVPHVLATSDLIATVASRVAAVFSGPHHLVTMRPPIEVSGFAIHLLWHARTQGDDAQRWLREQIAATATGPSRATPRASRAAS